MKLWRVNFHILIGCLGVIFFFNISVYSQTNLQQDLIAQRQLDTVLSYYRKSDADSIDISKRLFYISTFLKLIEPYQEDTLVYMGLMRKTKLQNLAKQYDSAVTYSEKLYDLSNRNNDTLHIIRASAKLGLYHKKNNQLKESFKFYNEAFRVSRRVGDSARSGRYLLQMANIQNILGDFSGSKATAIEGVKFAEKIWDIKRLSGLYHIISVSNLEQNNFDEALKYNIAALSLGENKEDAKIIGRKHMFNYQNTKANILSRKKDFNQAISILDTLRKEPSVIGNKEMYARVLSNLGHILWLQDSQNITSEELLLQARGIRKEINDAEGLIASNIHLTKFYQENDKGKALFFANSAYQNALKRESLVSIIEALGYVIQLKDSPEEARIYHKTSKELEEINQSNRAIYVETKYENDKLTTENLVLKAETAKKERQRIIYLFGSILLVLIAGSVFYMVQQRHKRQIIRNVYDAEARISKKLHDELANDVYNVMIQIQNDQSRKEVLDKLEDIYNSTRDISRENSSFNEVRDFHLELSNMLSSYSADYTKIIIKDVGEINWQSITPEKKIIVYRILQELMINMKKHSEASLVAITFKKEQKTIKITYADNGVGVDKDEIIYSSGLRNAENRIKTIGGSFIFDSEMERGFKATVHFPN